VAAGTHKWATPGRAFWGSTNQESPNASEAAQAGDTVYIAAGTYIVNRTKTDHYNGTLYPANVGTAGNQITFQAVGTVVLQQTGERGPILGVRAYTVLDGFTVNEANALIGADSGVIHSSAENATIQNCTIVGTYDDIEGEDNHSGIRIQGGGSNLIKNNDISGFTGNNGNNDAEICMYYADNTVIEHNKIHDGVTGIHIKGDCNGTIVRYNLIYGHSNKGIRLLQTGESGNTTKIYQNIIRDSDYVGIEFNASAPGYPQYTYVVNNTIVDIAQVPILFNDGVGENNYVYNNILYGGTHGIYSTPATNDHFTSNYNNVYASTYFGRYNSTNYETRAAFSSASGWDANSITTDPSFVDYANDNFKLNAGSGAIGTGLDILDLDGDSATDDAITMGAYITGNETIGIETSGSTPTRKLNNVTGVRVTLH